MRVAVDATPLVGDRTGVGAFTHGALTALADRDDTELVAYALSWRAGRSLAAAVPPGVRRVKLPMPPELLRALWARRDWPVAEYWTGRVDVVHGTNFVVPPTRGAAAVVTVHDLTPVRFPELCSADPLAYPDLVRRALARGAWVHAPSTFVAAEVVDLLGADPDRVVVVAEGVPAVAESAPGAGGRLAGGRPYLLAVGTVEPRKGYPTLVRAFDEVARERPELLLVIAGADAWGAGDLAAAIEAVSSRQRIRRLGYVSQADRAALLRDAEVLAFPSLYEGFGLPALEAMSVGLPVVSTRAGAIPEVLGDAALLVEPGDPESLGQALARVLHDQPLRQRLTAAGRSRAAGYSWEACATGLSTLYRRAAAAP